MKILLLQLEFSRWNTARPWSYPMNFGIAKTLRDNGHETFTIPVIPDQNVEFQMSWLGRARELCHGMKFDQVWVWLLHYPYTQEILEWINRLAPIRIGVLVESMQYDEDDYLRSPTLRNRPGIIRQQVQSLTHVLASDENDIESIISWGYRQAMWWPCGVPERVIVPFQHLVEHPKAVFHGTLYDKRETYLSQHRLQEFLTFPTSDMCRNEFHQLFDEIQIDMESTLKSGQFVNAQDLQRFVMMLDQVRHGEFRKWMEHLQSWAVIVNLPSYAKFYGGRVFEGLAVGRPVISWDIPNHPKNNALFQDGEDILLFPKDDSDGLANHIDRLLTDSNFAKHLVLNAQRKLCEFHTIEKRVRDVLQWVQSGVQPSYDARSENQGFSLKARETAVGWHSTTRGLSLLSDPQREKPIETLQKVKIGRA